MAIILHDSDSRAYSDYLKFTLPMAYSMSIVSWGAIEWFQGYQLANQDGYLRDMIKWGTDWLIQAHPQPNVFYVQVSCQSAHSTHIAHRRF